MTTIPAGILQGNARDVFNGIVRHYKVKPDALLRVIIEHVLDSVHEEGAMQQHLAACARHCARTGVVPDCWLELEGGDDDAEPDDDAGGSDGDEDAGDDGDEDWDTNERHDLGRAPHPRTALAVDDDDLVF